MRKQVKILAVLMFGVLLFSCKSDKQENISSTTNYDYEKPTFSVVNFKEEIGDCTDSEANCLAIDIQYPKVEIGNELLDQAMNDFALGYITDYLVVERPIETQNTLEYITAVVEEEKQLMTEWAEDDRKIKQFQLNMEPVYTNPYFTTIYTSNTSFEGGAHPIEGAGYRIFENETGKIINNTVIVNDKPIRELMLQKIKLSLNSDESEDLEQLGFLISDNDFAITNSFGITADSLKFVYSPYEIAPYDVGFINIGFSKEEIEEYLNDNFVEKWSKQ